MPTKPTRRKPVGTKNEPNADEHAYVCRTCGCLETTNLMQIYGRWCRECFKDITTVTVLNRHQLVHRGCVPHFIPSYVVAERLGAEYAK